MSLVDVGTPIYRTHRPTSLPIASKKAHISRSSDESTFFSCCESGRISARSHYSGCQAHEKDFRKVVCNHVNNYKYLKPERLGVSCYPMKNICYTPSFYSYHWGCPSPTIRFSYRCDKSDQRHRLKISGNKTTIANQKCLPESRVYCSLAEISRHSLKKTSLIRGAPSRKTQRRKQNREFVFHSQARKNSILLAKVNE